MKSTAYDNTTAYDNISDEELGAKIRKSHQRHLENVKAHSAIWQKEGQAYRNVRENLKISQSEISENIGACVAVVSKFEQGKYVRSRNLVTHAYNLAMEHIQNERNAIMEGAKKNGTD